jgi:hypothetical protein
MPGGRGPGWPAPSEQRQRPRGQQIARPSAPRPPCTRPTCYPTWTADSPACSTPANLEPPSTRSSPPARTPAAPPRRCARSSGRWPTASASSPRYRAAPGGGARMARISGLSRPTVYAGVRELDAPPDPRGRIRRPGGGPPRLVERQPGLLQALDELVDPSTRGDPESPLRWTCKSTRQLADALAAQGFRVSADTVGRRLKQHRYTLQRTQRPRRAASTPTGTRSLGISTSRPGSSWLPASRSSASTPRKGAGRPLTSHEAILELIAATRTSSGLRVQAELDRRRYPPGAKVSDRDLAAVPLHRHRWHGEWKIRSLAAQRIGAPRASAPGRTGSPAGPRWPP